MNEDSELLRRYAQEGAEDAFAELVHRHLNLVFSAALRQLNGDAHLAADAAQLVFADLARKAGALSRHRVLAGWLFTSTRFTAAKLVRTERRRQAREQEAQLMHELNPDDPDANLDWQQVRPVLDEALAELSDAEREAILLRFFEGRDFANVGARLNVADNTARMRVERALDKLRGLLARRGVTSTSAALAAALSSQAVVAAPAGLAASIAGAALAGAGVAGAAAGTGSAGAAALGFMSMTKLQLGMAGALAVAGATGYVVQLKANAQLRDEVSALRQENQAITALKSENLQMARTAVAVAEMRQDDVEFRRLQEEAAVVKARLAQVARAEQARAAAVAEVFELSRLDQTPRPRFQARPQYPTELRRAGTAGEVVVDFVVDPNGDVQKAYALRSSDRGFEAAAVEAVSKWKFQPGQKGGRSVATHLQIPIVFTLDGPSKAGAATATDPAKGRDGPEGFRVHSTAAPGTPPAK